MEKFTVMKSFRDKYTKVIYAEGSVIELTPERVKEIRATLKGQGTFIKKAPSREEE